MLINLTSHVVRISGGRGGEVVVRPSGTYAKLRVLDVFLPDVDGVPAVGPVVQGIDDLPGPSDGVSYVVSRVVFEHCWDRPDVYAPGRPIRDKEGRIAQVYGLVGHMPGGKP